MLSLSRIGSIKSEMPTGRGGEVVRRVARCSVRLPAWATARTLRSAMDGGHVGRRSPAASNLGFGYGPSAAAVRRLTFFTVMLRGESTD